MSVISSFTMSPPVSVSAIESLVSDIESISATGTDRTPATLTPIEVAAGKYQKSNKDLVLETPDVQERFDFSDGDAYILAGNVLVATHKYLLKRFGKLGNRISDGILVLGPEDPSVEDFRNTLKILYASVIEDSSEFDPTTLTSALRLATAYDYPALRAFAIKRLQNAFLSAIDRIRLAREFGLSSWEEPAYVELCNRDEAITTSEASVLGLDTFVHLAKIREKEQRRRGRDIDAAMEDEDNESLPDIPQVPGEGLKRIEPVPQSAAHLPITKKKRTRRGTGGVSKVNDEPNEPQAGQAQEDTGKEGENKSVESPMNPCFIDTTIPALHNMSQLSNCDAIHLPVADCTCSYRCEDGLDYYDDPCDDVAAKWRCNLPVCAVRAFKDLQTQQIAHASSITQLKSVIGQIQTPPRPPSAEVPEDSASHSSIGFKSVQEEVRRWLGRCRVEVECEDS